MGQRLIFFIALTIFVSCQYEAVAAPPVRPPIRIVNGTEAAHGEFPYIVELRLSDGAFTCGGVILGVEWILTAGHCVKGGRIDSVVYGTNKLYDFNDGHPDFSIDVKSWFLHPKFYETDKAIPFYDVGILQLKKPIPLGPLAQPIKLAEANATVPFHVQGVLSGWGNNDTLGFPMLTLQKIYLQLLTDQECQKKIFDYNGDDSFDPTNNICSDDYYNGGCYGDSGSPYVINGTQYGIISWSFKPCGIVPAVYTRISYPENRNWIKEVTNI